MWTFFISAMPHALLTPPATPPPQHHSAYRGLPPTPESRLGKFLGSSLELKAILGTGAYGVVYSAFNHLTGIWYAVKALSKTNANGVPLDRRQKEFQSREIQLHYAASAHPNIVSMLKIEEDKDCTYVILEYFPEGDLFSNITEKGRYVGDDVAIRKAFLQILNAVEHCHNLGIYHRDLKPENILVAKDQVFLADFGLATTDPESEDHGCGSTFYMSPECLDQSRKSPYRCAPNDIWSLGVILVNLTCGRNPWKQASVEDSTYKAFSRNRRFLKTILPLSDELNDILGMVFERNPEERITIGQLKGWIFECHHFTATSQQMAKSMAIQQLPSPPQSRCSSGMYDAPSPASCSDSDSVFSDAGLTDSSDGEDPDSDYDSEDGAMDQDVPVDLVDSPVDSPKFAAPAAPKERRPRVHDVRPSVVFPQQQYGLPQEHPYPVFPAKTSSQVQYWAPYPQPRFERLHAVPHVYQPCYTPPPPHYPFYPHNQYAVPSGWY